jgi:hypothetical protein
VKTHTTAHARRCAVAFVEFYRQWPGYFCDSFQAVQAGDLRRDGFQVHLFKAYMHDAPEEITTELLEALASHGPFDLLITDRVWSQRLLARVKEAAGDPALVINQWEEPARWPEVDYRISPLSRRATLDLARHLRDSDAAPPELPNLHRRDAAGDWCPPALARPLQVADEFASPLDMAYDTASFHGLDEAEASRTRYLVLNMGCPYRGAENTSGFFDGLELGTAWGDKGCTFCNVGPYERQTDAERLASMTRQLDAIVAHGPFDRLVVQDEYIFRDLDTLVEEVCARGITGVDLMVRARVDYVERCEPQLVRALELLGDRGTITPYLIGFENFSDAELARYNKGQTGAESEEAIAHLRALAAEHPNLQLSQSQGFILFGPWTTLEDLEINVQALRRVGFESLRGRFTSSKIRLNPDAALVHRAHADGLVTIAFGRDDEGNAAATGYQAEIPYRFNDPDTARVWELLNGENAIWEGDEVERLERAIAQVRAEQAGRPSP